MNMREVETKCTAGAGEAWPSRRSLPRAGFSLVELLIVIGIIASLVGIFVPTIAKARESAIRVQCASNLRQCGLAERLYAQENGGWLFLRALAHPGTVQRLTSPNGGLMTVSVGKYASPAVWFCPNFATWGTGHGALWSDQEKINYVAINRIGYGVYGAGWDGTQVISTDPFWGVDTFINGGAYKITHLKNNYVRMSEWFVVGGGGDTPMPFHTTGKHAQYDPTTPRPAGGNMLMGDGSVQWSRGMWKYFGGQIYTVPESRNVWP